jgi:ATP-dependent protease ClpP protease subunit
MQNTATLLIYQDIGPDSDDMFFGPSDVFSAKKCVDFLSENAEATDIIVRINSRGGDVQEGWTIYDLLSNSGKNIKTIGEGKVYSIATVVFMAGTEREMLPNADGLIHMPFIPPYTLADAYTSDELAKLSEDLKQEEEKILAFYADKTGYDKEKLRAYMEAETKLSAEDMMTLGFATKIAEPIKAVAYYKFKNNNRMDEKSFWDKFEGVLAKFNLSRLSPKSMELTDTSGNKLTVEKESGDPAVGDKASPDGTFTLENGKTITVSGGSITEVKEPVVAKDEKLTAANAEIDALKKKCADLEAENATAKASMAEVETAKTSFVAKEAEAMALVAELQTLKNEWKPENRSTGGITIKVGDIDLSKVSEMIKTKNSK